MVSSLSKYCNTQEKQAKELREQCPGLEWHLQAAAAVPHLSQDTQADEDELLL